MTKPNPDDWKSSIDSYEHLIGIIEDLPEPPFRETWKDACMNLLREKQNSLKAGLIELKRLS